MYFFSKYQKRIGLCGAITLSLALSACSKTSYVASSVESSMVSKIPVKVVVVSMFENGEVTGDRPGEFQMWVEGRNLDKEYDFPLGEYTLRMDDEGVLGLLGWLE